MATRGDAHYRYLVLEGNESKLMREAMERRAWWMPAEEGGNWNLWFGGNGQKMEWAKFSGRDADQQVVNRIDNHKEVVTKSGLAANLALLAQQADAPSWIPETHVLSQGSPKDQASFKRAYERHTKARSGMTWIVKPTNANRGNGIEVFNKVDKVLSHVNTRKPGAKSIVQKYIDEPLLVHGRKFDLRAYVLVTPNGEVFLHREAYVRTCGTPYVLDDLSNKAAHLTNDAVQKKTEEYGLHEDHCKLSLDELQAAVGDAVDVHGAVRAQMVDCVRRLFGLVAPKLNPRRLAHCFELFGLDFMIDAKGRVFLIEVNTSPALFLAGRVLSDLLPRVVEEVVQKGIDAVLPPPPGGGHERPEPLDGFERMDLIACEASGALKPKAQAAAAGGAAVKAAAGGTAVKASGAAAKPGVAAGSAVKAAAGAAAAKARPPPSAPAAAAGRAAGARAAGSAAAPRRPVAAS
ncbi:hypothetical protein FOA52_011677 [Chlamydomonas sp. UWO 241]|nr:hypothetical protein FOA52_011677 [Chlamydomonas sp. UWO 241]